MERSEKNKAIILAQDGLTTNLLVEEVSKFWDIQKVIVEDDPSPIDMLKKRAKKVGWLSAIGQALFILLVPPLLPSKKRIFEITKKYGYSPKEINDQLVDHVHSINTNKTIELIHSIKPDLIFVNGTQIISKNILDQINVPIINIHVGITPKYRGVHGGYWAIYNKEPHLFGVTLHYIDAGIDTGTIIDQRVIEITKADNYKTYPILQYVNGLKLLRENRDLLELGKTNKPPKLTEESQLHYHPRLCQYIWHRFNGVK